MGEFDIELLRQMQRISQDHLTIALGRAEGVITAASDPADYIDTFWLDEFGVLASDAWNLGEDLITGIVPGTMIPRRFVSNLIEDAIEDSKRSYFDLLKALIADRAFNPLKEPVYGEFRQGDLVQYGDVRPLMVKLGGGSTDATVELIGGVTTGKTMQSWLEASGVTTDEKIWLYGYEEQPRRTFNGHLQMDGLVFEQWDDEGLRIAPQDVWLRRKFYQPGDHWGCACVVAPYFPNFGEPFLI